MYRMSLENLRQLYDYSYNKGYADAIKNIKNTDKAGLVKEQDEHFNEFVKKYLEHR